MNEQLYNEVLHECIECIRAWKSENWDKPLNIIWGDYVAHCYNYGGSQLHNAIDRLMDGMSEDQEADATRSIEHRLLLENVGEEQGERIYIGRRIAELRADHDMTQQELAEKTGIKREHVSRIEAGKYSVGLDILAKVAKALGSRIDFL